MVLAAKRRGLDAIALTDHDTCAGLPEALEAGERYGVLVIPGVELLLRYGSRHCHVLALGVGEMPALRDPGVTDVVKWVRDQGGATVDAHPFMFNGAGRRAGLCDAVEVHNSTGQRITDLRAEVMAARLGKSRVAGSDAHSPEMVGLGRTWVDSEPTVPAMLQAIREGRTRIASRTFIRPAWFFRWVERYCDPAAKTRVKFTGAVLYTGLLGQNALALTTDFASCVCSGQRWPWRLPE